MWSTPHFNSIFQVLNFILVWSPSVFIPLVFILALLGSSTFKLTWKLSFQVRRYFNFRFLIATMILFRLMIAALASFLQYAVWSGSVFSRLFLPPRAPWSYFAHYVFTHFWLNALLSISAAVFLWLVFEALRRRHLGVINREESLVAFCGALIVGWPGFLVFVPTALFIAALYSITQSYLEARFPSKPTFEWPLLVAISIALFFAKSILTWLGLTAIFA